MIVDLGRDRTNASELDSIVSNGTSVLVDLPPGYTTIGCKWIFKWKLKPDGTIDKFKARLVAKGFKQKEGIDYFDIYSSVARLTTIRVLIELASVYNLTIHQIDVKTTFLYGELEEEIYMDQPEGFVAHGNEHKVCKLVKSLYRLKQAPKQWHEKFDKTILAFGFTVNENDKCIYCKVKGDKMIILCLYVDDILLIGSCLDIITETKSFLKNKFEMKDIGEANVILGIKLTRSTDGIAISQSHYVEKIIEKFGYQNSRIDKTPYGPSVALLKNESGVPVAQLRHSQIIGSLQYLANGTRPDISFSVSKLARYTSCPDKTHWGALDKVLRYLKGSVSLAIHYGRFLDILEGYSDASWIAKNSGSNGLLEVCKTDLIIRSTFEAELCALDTTGTEVEWLFGLLSQLSIVSQPLSPIAVHCDSQTTIAKVRSRKYNQKTKRHIQVRLKSIRALVSDRVMGIDFVGTKDNVADPLTKGLNLSQVHKSRLGMGLKTH
ncbi:UNVERIFIED_CONTAM: Retrovirus-related Pol polyprotein from transposon TNT 1-94, partial [Sesamum indicum]